LSSSIDERRFVVRSQRVLEENTVDANRRRASLTARVRAS
jgi:hypothetical protein